MINLVLRASAVTACCIAISPGIASPVHAGDCPNAELGFLAPECRAAGSRSLRPVRPARRLPAPALDDEITVETIEAPLNLDLESLAPSVFGSPGMRPAQDALTAKAAAPTPPKTAGTGLGTWSKLKTERAGDEAQTQSGLGIDYRAIPGATLGIAVENQQNVVASSVSEQSKLAASLGLKPSPLLNFEAKAAMARQGAGGVSNLGTQSAHNEISARVEGDWRLGGFKMAPSVSVARAAEAGGSETAKAAKDTVVVAPSISRPVALGPERTFEPFFGFKQEVDLTGTSAQPGTSAKPEVTRSAGGGVKLESRDAYSLSVTTDIENLDAEKHAVKSQLRLNLQLK